MAAHRIGLVVPSSNVTVETELPALLNRHAAAAPARGPAGRLMPPAARTEPAVPRRSP
jgi:maleate cis-trans isomerase